LSPRVEANGTTFRVLGEKSDCVGTLNRAVYICLRHQLHGGYPAARDAIRLHVEQLIDALRPVR
jgi:hypothetical protein